MKEAFMLTGNMILTATDVPDLSNVTDMSYMFHKAGRSYQITSSPYKLLLAKKPTFNSSINRWNVRSYLKEDGKVYYQKK